MKRIKINSVDAVEVKLLVPFNSPNNRCSFANNYSHIKLSQRVSEVPFETAAPLG